MQLCLRWPSVLLFGHGLPAAAHPQRHHHAQLDQYPNPEDDLEEVLGRKGFADLYHDERRVRKRFSGGVLRGALGNGRA